MGYRKIKLTQGQYALVDACDYEELSKHKWCAWWSPITLSFYAVCRGPVHGVRTNTYMHREILGFMKGDKRQGDHALHKTLDNRRIVRGKDNLRIASHAENQRNGRLPKHNTSGYKGVSRVGLRWAAYIRANGKKIYLGTRETPKAAYKLYTIAAKQYHGKFARLK